MSIIWPRQVDLIRHASSTYNELKDTQHSKPLYRAFMAEFARDPHSRHAQQLAEQLTVEYSEIAGDSHTSITEEGRLHMIKVGEAMSATSDLPDIIYVSPYSRTKQSLAALIKGWPELAKVRILEDERIREREFGLRIMFGDNEVFQSLHPEQKRLRDLQGPYWYRMPQGENIPDVRMRMRQWTSSVIRRHPGQHVLALTHHISILSFRANIERLTAEQYTHLDNTQIPPNCSVTTYRGQVHPKLGHQRLQLIDFGKLLA